MSGSCCTNGLDSLFTERISRHDANRYRRHGLTKRARKLITAIQKTTSIAGKHVLEIGVGVGAVTIELLRGGARAATGVDAVATQLAQARELAAEYGVADRLELVLGEFTAASGVGRADIVLLDRVICCYPDWRGMLAAAATRAGESLAMTYPRDVWWLRLGWRIMNVWQMLVRSDFRLYLHSPGEMHELLRAHGLTPRVAGRYYGWEIMTAVRASA